MGRCRAMGRVALLFEDVKNLLAPGLLGKLPASSRDAQRKSVPGRSDSQLITSQAQIYPVMFLPVGIIRNNLLSEDVNIATSM